MVIWLEERGMGKNYRPITILPTLDKLFEKLLGKQFTEHMDPKLSKEQWVWYHITETNWEMEDGSGQ